MEGGGLTTRTTIVFLGLLGSLIYIGIMDIPLYMPSLHFVPDFLFHLVLGYGRGISLYKP